MASTGCPVGQHCIFLPVLQRPVSGDISVTGVEVSQSIQDPQNSVPLVSGKATTLRIYTQMANFIQAPTNVNVSVTATRSNLTLNNSPSLFSAPISASSSRSNYQSTINFSLPSDWLNGTVDLTIKIDPYNRVDESNESNNTITQHLVFNNVPTLRVMIVPIKYTRNGVTYPAPTLDTISSWIRKAYPISQIEIKWHAPYAFSGDLGTSDGFSQLLNEITTLKSSEKAPSSQVYYGLIPTSNGSTAWFRGGIAGIGWIGSRTSIGLDYSNQSAQIAGHEIGHNLGMWHTPCGGAADADPKFPYSDGSIGQYGLDVTTGTVYAPTSMKDLMSYCDPKWVSDYTYKQMYSAQIQYGSAALTLSSQDPSLALAQRSLLLRAEIRDGKTRLMPAYVLSGQVSQAPEAGDYTVQILGQHDEVLTEMPVSAYVAGEPEAKGAAGINALVPLPDQPAFRVRLLHGSEVVAEQTLKQLTGSHGGPAVEPKGKGYQVRWADTQQTALVRYSADGGKTWSTLSVDATGGEAFFTAEMLPEQGGTFEVIPAGIWQ